MMRFVLLLCFVPVSFVNGLALSGRRPDLFSHSPAENRGQSLTTQRQNVSRMMRQAGVALGLVLLTATNPAFAADFAGKDLSGRDFSGADLAGKDFTAVVAKGTKFHNSNLQGCTFTKSDLRNADFSGADLRGAHFEGTTLDGSSFKDANAQRAVFSPTILDIADLENVDLTDSIWPSKLQIMICDMDELKGTNEATGNDSRRSILCPY